jgi:hypothetical protein
MRFGQRRDRVVLFRVTEHEYGVLEKLCAEKGGHSLSGFARAELLGPQDDDQITSLRNGISVIADRMSNLETQHNDLARRVLPAQTAGPSPGQEASR